MQATGRLRRWLYSVDGGRLDGRGLAFTLTVRDLPRAADDWSRTRKLFLDRMRREGLVRGQWLTEWQRRGVPHLHGCAFFPEDSDASAATISQHWLSSAAEWRPRQSGQSVTPLWGLPGWFQYQAKHSSRGVRHYQRANVPESWREGTGRLWGVVGEWPVREELHSVDMATFHRFRRLLRSWMVADARAEGRVYWAADRRRLLRCGDPMLSAVRGVGEFIPENVSRELLLAAAWGDLETASDVERRPTPGAGA